MEYNVANMTAIRVWSFRIGLLFFLGEVATVVVLVFGGWRVINGLMTIGTLVAFATYLRMLSEPIRNMGMIINVIARTMASGERIFEILNAKPEIKSPENAIDMTDMRGHVVFDHVTFGYTRARPVLHDLSLEAKPGQVIGLFGLTGSGKSSLTGLMTRFYDVNKGKVLIDGHDVRTVDLDSLRRNIGIVMQETFLFSATLRENIAFGRPDASLEEVVAAAKAAQAHRFISELPDGYDSIIGERGVNLSGGQKQRIAIARALLLNPRILILDDSTSAVDTETEFQIQQALKQVMQGRTTFIIAQRLLSLRHADEIIVLEKGRVVQRGHHEELLEQPGLYREVYDLQLRDQERMLQVGD
jgi:ATP-binding cassette subfamily B protein